MDTKPIQKRAQLPAIRQTKTSMFRMIKANPLLRLKNVPKSEPLKTTDSFAASVKDDTKPTTVFVRSQSLRGPSNAHKTVPTRLRRAASVREKQLTKISKLETIKHCEKPTKIVSFKTSTPTNTPTPALCRYRGTPFRVTPEANKVNDLCQHLSEWLLRNDKPLNSFNNLQRFADIAAGFDVENKENVEPVSQYRTSSYEDISPTKSENLTTLQRNYFDFKKLSEGILSDLYNLISVGYPVLQCEAWLEVVYENYRLIEKVPKFWECRALIEQRRDNITKAVECYRAAIIYGAEVNAVDQSLDNLLEKFKLFSIASEKKPKRVKILSDARNIFKTCIIDAAIREKNLKKKEVLPDVLDTPVQSRSYGLVYKYAF